MSANDIPNEIYEDLSSRFSVEDIDVLRGCLESTLLEFQHLSAADVIGALLGDLPKWDVDDIPPVGYSFSISMLICARFLGSYASFFDGNSKCSDISQRISESLIKVAATRIFSDPSQSFVEPITNAIDTTRRKYAKDNNMPLPRSIGKFGMGFFSVLYWVLKGQNVHVMSYHRGVRYCVKIYVPPHVNTQGEHIPVTSDKIEERFEKMFKTTQGGTPHKAWQTFRNQVSLIREYTIEDANLKDILSRLDPSDRKILHDDVTSFKKTTELIAEFIDPDEYITRVLAAIESGSGQTNLDLGRDILKSRGTVVCMSLPLVRQTVETFALQLARFRFVGDVIVIDFGLRRYGFRTYMNTSVVNPSNTADINSIVTIFFEETKHNVFVADNGESLPLNVLFGSLLIPSISTKTLTTNVLPVQFNNTTRVIQHTYKESKGGITITVGDIVVVDDLALGTVTDDSVSSSVSRSIEFVITLPLDTQLPVSRDDVIVVEGSTTFNVLWDSLRMLADQAIQLSVSLDYLLTCLRKYGTYSQQPSIAMLEGWLYTYIISKTDVIYIPDMSLVNVLRVEYPRDKFSYLKTINVERTYRQLDDLLDANGVDGRNVFRGVRLVPMKTMSSNMLPIDGGLPPYVFFPATRLQPNLKEYIVSTNAKSVLQSYDSVSNDDEWDVFVTNNLHGQHVTWHHNRHHLLKVITGNETTRGTEGDILYVPTEEHRNDVLGKPPPTRCVWTIPTKYDKPAVTRAVNSIFKEMINKKNPLTAEQMVCRVQYLQRYFFIGCIDKHLFKNTVLSMDKYKLKDTLAVFQFITGVRLVNKMPKLLVMPPEYASTALGQYVRREGGSPVKYDLREILQLKKDLEEVALQPMTLMQRVATFVQIRNMLATNTALMQVVQQLKAKLPVIFSDINNLFDTVASPLGHVRLNIIEGVEDTGVVYSQTYTPIIDDLKRLYSVVSSFTNLFDPSGGTISYYTSSPDGFSKVDKPKGYLMIVCLMAIETCMYSSGHDYNAIRKYISNLEMLFFNFKMDASYGVKTDILMDVQWNDPIVGLPGRYTNTDSNGLRQVYPALYTHAHTYRLDGKLFDTQVLLSIPGYGGMVMRSMNELVDVFSRTGRYPTPGRFFFLQSSLFIPHRLISMYVYQKRVSQTVLPWMYKYINAYIGGNPDEKTLASDHGLHILLRSSNDGFEACIVIAVFLFYLDRNWGTLVGPYAATDTTVVVPIDTILSIVTKRNMEYILAETRKRYPVSFFHEWKRTVHMFMHFNEYIGKYTTTYFEPMILALSLISRDGVGDCSLSVKIPTGVTRYVIRANQLIDYVFYTNTKNLRDDNDHASLISLLKRVSHHTLHEADERPQFQIIQIASNEGTSKVFIDAVITELVQNSVDAIRYALSEGWSIPERVDIELCDRDVLELAVTDHVGIPDSALLGLCIPFLSTKTLSTLMTGEMGTGFFNAYRQPYTKCVVIETRDLVIVATPILDVNKKRVLDIEYSFSVIPERQNRRQTDIRVVFNDISKEERVHVMIDATSFVHNTLGYLPSDVYYNGARVSSERVIVNESDVGKCYAMVGVKRASILLTNGIPMGDLIPFLEGISTKPIDNYDIHVGMVIDLNKGYYTPNQSRNRLVKTDELNYALEQFLEESIINYLTWYIHHATFVDGNQSIIEEYLPNTSSKEDINQFIPYGGTRKTMLHDKMYTIYHRHNLPRIVCDLNDEIQLLKKEGVITNADFDRAVKDTYRFLLWDGEVYIGRQTQLDLLRKWFVGKLLPGNKQVKTLVVGTSTTTSTGKGKGKLVKADATKVVEISEESAAKVNKIVSILTNFIEVYYAVGKRSGFTKGVNFSVVPKVKMVVITGTTPALGHYSPNDHAISVNYVYLESVMSQFLGSWDTFILKSKKDPIQGLTYAKTEAYFRRYIGLICPLSSLMVHEIQHALRGTDHTSASAEPHGHSTIVLGGKTYDVSFEEGCNLVCSTIVGGGLWTELLKRY